MDSLWLGRGLVAFALILPACTDTSQGAKRIQWVQDSPAAVQKQCGGDVWNVVGCYKWEGDTCFVYTRPMKSETDRVGMETLGHEVRHCFEGDFHARLSY